MTKKKKQQSPLLEMSEPLSLDDRVKRIETALGRNFTNKTIVEEALTLPGASSHPHSRPDAHKDLALVGDAVLSLALIMEGYQRGYDRGEIQSLFFFSYG